MSEKIGLTIADLRMLKNLYQHEKNRSYNTYLILDRLVRILENNGKINKEDYVLQEVIKAANIYRIKEGYSALIMGMSNTSFGALRPLEYWLSFGFQNNNISGGELLQYINSNENLPGKVASYAQR